MTREVAGTIDGDTVRISQRVRRAARRLGQPHLRRQGGGGPDGGHTRHGRVSRRRRGRRRAARPDEARCDETWVWRDARDRAAVRGLRRPRRLARHAAGAAAGARSTICCSAAAMSSIRGTRSARSGTSPSRTERSPPWRRRIDPAEALKTVDASGLYVTPGLIDIHVARLRRHRRARLLRRRQQPLPRRVHVPRRGDHGRRRGLRRAGATSRTSSSASSIGRRPACSPSSTSSATGCAAAQFEQDLADMEAKPTAEMALRTRA